MLDLSVCLITCNEEKNIFRSLKSIWDIADEIIVVDTGSTDHTLSIAKNFKSRIFQIDWEEDFSKARNFALDQARGRWVLIIDADEELLPEGKEALKILLNESRAEGYFVQILNVLENKQILKNRAVRLFRNRPEYRFKGRIHEQIVPSILEKKPQSIFPSPIEFLHFGYHESILLAKQERNLKIIEKELEVNPQDPFTLSNLGTTYFIMKNFRKAAENYELALEYARKEEPYTATIFRNLANTYLNLKEYEKCLCLLEQGIAWYPDYTDLYYLLAHLFEIEERWEKAGEVYKVCLKLGDVDSYVSSHGIGSFLSALGLARVQEQMGNYQEALEVYIKALVYTEVREEALEAIPPLALFTGYKGKDIIEKIEQFSLKGKDYFKLADTYAYWDDFSTALEILQFFAETDAIKFYKGYCLLHTQNFSKALEVFRQINVVDNPVLFWSNIFLCGCGLRNEELIGESIANLKEALVPERYQILEELQGIKQKEILNPRVYLEQCWKLLQEFINLDLVDWVEKTVAIGRRFMEYETLFLTIVTMWQRQNPLMEDYLKQISRENTISFLTVVEAHLNLEKENYIRSWELFNLASSIFPEDPLVKAGLAFSALKEASRIAQNASARFNGSELINERLKVINTELPLLEKKYGFVCFKRRKENEVLQTLIKSLHDNEE